MKKFISIENYIQSFPDNTQEVLLQLYACIKQHLPAEVDEVISYGIPTFKLNGTYVVYFAGFAKHVSLFPAPVEDPNFIKEFTNYKTGKGTIQFSLTDPLPEKLIQKIVEHLLKQNKIKHQKK